MFKTSSVHGISLDATGLIALADLKIISHRTALTGSASYVDMLFIAPGIHCQRDASLINDGAASMRTGCVWDRKPSNCELSPRGQRHRPSYHSHCAPS